MKTRNFFFALFTILLSSLVMNSQTATALNFSATSSYRNYIETLDPNFGTTDFTIEAWFKPNSLVDSYLMSTRTSESAASGNWWVLHVSGGITFETGNCNIGSQLNFSTTNTVITLGSWNHVTLVRSGLTFSIYVNGTMQASVSEGSTRSFITGNNVMRFGAWTNFNQKYFAGDLDEVKVWSYARAASDLSSNSLCEIQTPQTGLYQYYRFNQGVASGTNTGVNSLTDASGNNRNGTLYNFMLTGPKSNWVSGSAINALPLITVANQTICAGVTTTIIPTGANTYTISGGSFTVNPTVASTYTTVGTDLNGCISYNTTLTVSVKANPTLTINSPTICAGNAASVMISGASTYTTSDGSTLFAGNSFTVNPNVTTTFSATGTGINGCVSSNVITSVIVNANPLLTINNATICAGNTANLVISGADTYTTTDGNTTFASGNFNVNPSATTTYSTVGTDTNGCVSSNAIATVLVNAIPTLTINAPIICTGKTASITISGATTYTTTDGSTTFSGNNFTVNPVATATYSAAGTNTNGCISNIVATVMVNMNPTLTVNTPTICSGNGATVMISGANTYTTTQGSLTFTSANFTVNPNTTTTYSAVGTDTNGCSSAKNVTVVVNITPTLIVNSPSVCPGKSVSIVTSGASTYTITGGNFTVSPVATTFYTVGGTAVNGCTAALVTSTVLVSTIPTISVSDATLCSGNSLLILPTGADTYTINSGSFTVNPTSTSSYSITGSNFAGCVASNTAVANVTVFTTPTVSIAGASICPGDLISLSPSGAASYSFAGSDLSYTSGLTSSVHPTITTSFSISGVSTDGCISASDVVTTIYVFTTPTVSVNGGAICPGASLTLIPSGATTYTISGGTFTVSPITSTSYSITGTNTEGCISAISVADVTVHATPTVSVSDAVICAGHSTVLLPSGANTYTISGGSFTVTPTSNTTYSISGIDANGCQALQALTTITVNTLPDVSVSASNATICVGETSSLTANGAANYSWQTMQTGSSIAVTPSVNTTYSVIGTDANGCTNVATITLITDLCTGMKQNSPTLKLDIYPNPSSGELTLTAEKNAKIEVVNQLGQTVYIAITEDNGVKIDIHHLPNGIYFVKETLNGQQRLTKVVKQ